MEIKCTAVTAEAERLSDTLAPISRASPPSRDVRSLPAAMNQGRTERSSDSETFLFKFGIEPMNPDGTKFGAVKDVVRERAVVDEKCPKCPHKGLNFYTMQLRSVDEGQTVFYECPKCGYTFSQNN